MDQAMHISELNFWDFRCFGTCKRLGSQTTAIPAGENSTRRTSFLALTRVLWNLAVHDAAQHIGLLAGAALHAPIRRVGFGWDVELMEQPDDG